MRVGRGVGSGKEELLVVETVDRTLELDEENSMQHLKGDKLHSLDVFQRNEDSPLTLQTYSLFLMFPLLRNSLRKELRLSIARFLLKKDLSQISELSSNFLETEKLLQK